uniref:L1 transposable element RRM domain-containing protein n=1 Tax=Rousettus aegyptiacus TaxID=9407 RepID=A0A7J8KB32_ROUAE|nr:hypothetical protein HJG63_007899 [Rousettus aegyptiacus]
MEIKTLKKNQIELLEMKSTLQELKSEIVILGNIVDQMEERISDIEDSSLETNKKEEERNRRMKNNEREIQELADTIRRGNIRIMDITEGEEKEQGLESTFRQIVDKNFPNLRNELEIRIQEVNRTPNCLNPKRPSPRHTVLKLPKINNKQFSRQAGRKQL